MPQYTVNLAGSGQIVLNASSPGAALQNAGSPSGATVSAGAYTGGGGGGGTSSTPSAPSTSYGGEPVYQTVNGPRTLGQMQSELFAAGWGGATGGGQEST